MSTTINPFEQMTTTTTGTPMTDSAAVTTTGTPFREHVSTAVEGYLQHLDGCQPANLYQIVLEEMEEPLIRTVLTSMRGNQSKAAIILGLSRGTLRKKMKKYGLLD